MKRDLEGSRFGRWTVIEKRPYVTGGGIKCSAYLCRCDCGTERIVLRENLVRGKTKSCGCYMKESASRNKTHGMSRTRLYNIYSAMKERCLNKNASNYERYGGRGIKICNEWLESPKAFFDWAKENGYASNLTIDRINNDDGYSPENCRWVTYAVQGKNTRRNRFITYDNKTRTLSDWEKITGISAETISQRIKFGWSIQRALTEKPFIGKNGFYCQNAENEIESPTLFDFLGEGEEECAD